MTLAEALTYVSTSVSSPVGRVVAGLVAAYLVYLFGLRSYFAQRDYEYLQRRYLEEGLDRVSADIGQALSVFRHNWQLTFRFLKLYRDSPMPIDAREFIEDFRKLDQSLLHIPAAHRVHTLAKNPLIWNGYQKAIAFVTVSNDDMRADFGTALLSMVGNPNDPNKAAFIRDAEGLVTRLNAEAEKFYVLLSVLQDLAEEAGRVRLTRRRVRRFHTKATVKQALKVLEPLFKE